MKSTKDEDEKIQNVAKQIAQHIQPFLKWEEMGDSERFAFIDQAILTLDYIHDAGYEVIKKDDSP